MLAECEEAALGLDEIHGVMSAALCGPGTVSFEDCVCAAFLGGGEETEESKCELPSALMEMLSVLYEDTLRSIEEGSFLPIVSCEQGDDSDEENPDAKQWCEGFLLGMEYNRSGWKLDNDRVLDLLAPIILLADQGEFEQAAAHVQEISADDFRQELLQSLPGSVCELRRFFVKKSRPRPVRKRPQPRRSKR